MNSRVLFATMAAVVLGAAISRAELNWLTDYNTALSQAKSANKLVLIDFTGSDWCVWCIKLKGEVFDKPEFAAFANANLVLLEVDFPRHQAQTEEQRAKNSVLQSKYSVEGYPTVIVASPDGHPLAQLGYEAGGPKAFIEGLKKIPGFAWKDGGASAATVANDAAKQDEPLWGGITFPPKRYDELKLTGLSGTATRRLAIINNQTFAAGETARVKLQGGDVKVLCKEIRAKSVLVQVEGASEAKELVLGVN